MSAADFDVVVLGANADGLTAAAELAGSGQRVLVLEPSLKLGGELLTESFLMPFRYDVHGGWLLDAFERLGDGAPGQPRALLPKVPAAFLFDDREPLVFGREAAALAGTVGAADVRALERLVGAGRRLRAQLRVHLHGGEPEVPGDGTRVLDTLDGLDVPQGLDALGFTDARLRCALTYLPLVFGLTIEGPGTALNLAVAASAVLDLMLVDGGAGVLAGHLGDAVVRGGGGIIEGFGGGSLRVENGAVTGVALADGRSFDSGAVLVAEAPAGVWDGLDEGPHDAPPIVPGDLGWYSVFAGIDDGPPLHVTAAERRAAVNEAYMVVVGFESEAEVHGHLAALRAGRTPPPAGHIVASSYADPDHPVASRVGDDNRLWCMSCHAREFDTLRRPPVRSIVWRGLAPVLRRELDPDASRKALAARSLAAAARVLEGLEPRRTMFQLLWLPEDSGDRLQAVDWEAAGRAPLAVGAPVGVRRGRLAPLARLTGLATGTALARAVTGGLAHGPRQDPALFVVPPA